MPRKITVSNIFGDFANGQALLEHYTAVFGGQDGFFNAWRWYEDAMSMLEEANATREEYPEVFAFADSLSAALEMC